jgi:hypothetical protein
MKKLFTICTLIISLQVSAQVNLTDQLYMYYNFNGNATDNSGNLHNGLVVGAVATTDRCNNPSSAMLFDGINDWITIYPALTDMNSYSIHAWVYYNDTTKSWRGIFSDSDPVPYKDVFMSITDTLIEVIYDKTQNGSNGTGYSNKSLLASWHQLVWVNSGTQSLLYVDTVLVKTINIAGQNVGYHDTAYIGKMCDGNQSLRFFKGKLDEFRIYSRAINTDEIAALYKLSCEVSGIGEPAVNQYTLNLFPNPAENALTFEVSGAEVNEVNIYSTIGNLIESYSNLSGNTMDVSQLPSGMYFAQFKMNGASTMRQFIKN